MIYTNSDGGARGNPGPGAIGVIVRREGEILMKHAEFLGTRVTNNEAEYLGLIKAMDLASSITNGEVTFILDSELIVKQLLGEYRVKNERLKPFFLRVQALIERFEKVKFLHVSRWNKFQLMADEMLNAELDKHGFPKSVRS